MLAGITQCVIICMCISVPEKKYLKLINAIINN